MNKLKLGKKKLLGFMTAGAIVVTMAGSYAVWDNLKGVSETSVTLRNPVTVEVTDSSDVSYTPDPELGATEVTYTSSAIKFTPTNLPTGTTATNLKVTAVAKGTDGNVASGVTVLVAEEGEAVGTSNTVTTDFATKEVAEAGKGYVVTVKADDPVTAPAGTYKIELTGELAAGTAAP